MSWRAGSVPAHARVDVAVIGGNGRVVAEYFDAGISRRRGWWQRPRATALLAALPDSGRNFDAVVIGEYERAFSGDQMTRLLPVFERHGVAERLPETEGPVDLGDPAHRALLLMLGSQSQREVLRARHRTLAAMRAQAAGQGRYLGGRPPYGYRLVEAGAHPNRVHAGWGRRLRRLEPDPATSPYVVRMFFERLAGSSVASIARGLNEEGVPCPAEVDAERNAHRGRRWWTLRTVACILANPRYTGRQVWNRYGTDHDHSRPVRRPNPAAEWTISTRVTHPALVTEADFVAAQSIRAPRKAGDGTVRTYALAGLVRCGVCGRRMDSHWINRRPGYRCRHGHTSSRPRTADQPRSLYVREDRLLDWLTAQSARARLKR
ncbi:MULTISPECIES: recombinase family protein [unclassified Saccharopolyspora]|uniref:recombinase family protein n=1 Tax=Saccharopolyspora TaxID=1835 RepID=UPI001909926C|nr:recombinase family protein [Saccharopolyspora sp. HNM0986]MBK0869884.1 recombinase family protein [Saccharopolyspora sp. HNM0986]